MTNNAILIFAENGKAQHKFCTEAQARSELQLIANACGNAHSFICDQDMDQELIYSVSPALREKVAHAKHLLGQWQNLKNALDKYDVPQDCNLRQAISKAFADIQAAA